jgi:hypothetical protein
MLGKFRVPLPDADLLKPKEDDEASGNGDDRPWVEDEAWCTDSRGGRR